MDFKIYNSGSADDGIFRLRALIKSLRGNITDSNRGGSFKIPFLFGSLNASFLLNDEYLNIHVSQHPIFVNRERMEKLFMKINKRYKVVLSVPNTKIN